jgi:hypothetical protein
MGCIMQTGQQLLPVVAVTADDPTGVWARLPDQWSEGLCQANQQAKVCAEQIGQNLQKVQRLFLPSVFTINL